MTRSLLDLDRWEDRLEREHPALYVLVFGVLFFLAMTSLAVLAWLLVPQS